MCTAVVLYFSNKVSFFMASAVPSQLQINGRLNLINDGDESVYIL